MAWDSKLEGAGFEIAGSNNERICVMAGPGTGKSFVLMRRVARLLEDEHVDPSQILAVTFTRTAAHDLITELNKLGVRGCDMVDACTLHKFCYRLLLKINIFNYLCREPRALLSHNKKGIYDHEIKPLLFDLIESGITSTQRLGSESIRAYEAAWARQQIDKPGSPINGTDQAFQRGLEAWLSFHRCMLIGEVVPLTLRFLRDNPANEIFNQYEHILVDEYQDLAKAEQELIDLLAKNCNLIIVGDQDQSIFSFRYAHPEGIIEFSDRHKSAKNQSLDNCRRCPPNIVELANNLIIKNHDTNSQPRLTPFPTNESGYIKIVQWGSFVDETQGITNFVKHMVKEKNIQPEDILILSPSKDMGYKIGELLEQA